MRGWVRSWRDLRGAIREARSSRRAPGASAAVVAWLNATQLVNLSCGRCFGSVKVKARSKLACCKTPH